MIKTKNAKKGFGSVKKMQNRIPRRNFLKNITIGCAAASIPAALLGAKKKDSTSKPNIVLILADDLGYGSLNSYGADNKILNTPHIDNITKQGMRFTNAHTPASICSPTRYGLLTGRYPWRTSLKSGVVNPLDPLLPDPDRVTIADWLKKQDYNTAAVGKWHLGYGKKKSVDYSGKLTPGPLDLGFDYHFGVPQNHGDMHGVYIENDHVYGLRSKKVQPYSRTFYGPQYIGYDAPQRVNKDVMKDLTNKSIEWLKKQNKEKPFFLYFAAVAVHHPITPSDYMRGLSGCGPYGDFIQDLDLSVGKIIETLQYMGLMDNTILFFTSDNGGDIPGKPKRPEMQAIKYGLNINGELRGDKHTIWNGGTQVPFIVSWHGKIKGGTVSKDMVNLVDVFATIADMTSKPLPGSKEIAPDSYSILSTLIGSKRRNKRTSMVTADKDGMHAIHMDGWKLIDNIPLKGISKKRARNIKKNKPQLYDLDKDTGEKNNLYAKKPELVKKLKKELEKIRKADSTR